MNRIHIRTVLFILIIVLTVVSIFSGVMDLTVAGLLQGDVVILHTLYYSRIPRTLALLLAGSSLAISGLIMQKISANPFVSPQTTITMDAVKFGVLCGLLLGLSAPMRLVLAVFSASVLTLIFLTLSKRVASVDTLTIPVLGIIFGSVLSALTAMIAMHFDLNQTLDGFFNKGFSAIFKGNYEILLLNGGLLLIAHSYYKRFSILALGRDVAQNFGLNTKRVTTLGIVLISSMSCVVMVSVGTIPFVGLLIPNLVALAFDDSVKGMFVDTILASSVFVLMCDILARFLVQPYEIPIVLVSGALGGILFLILVMRGHHETT